MAAPTKVILGRDDNGQVVYGGLIDSGLLDGEGNHLFFLPNGQVEANSLAQRVVARPTDVGSLGAYVTSVLTGTMAAGIAGASPVFSFRNGGASVTNLVLIKRVAVAMTSLGTGFTAGVGLFEMFAARAFSVADTGGAGVNVSGNFNKLRTSFASSFVTNSRIATTAALTPGTRTLDGNAMGQIFFAVSTALNTVMLPTTDIFKRDLGAGDWPYIAAQNEGFIIQATVPATGTWQMQVLVDWLEVAAF
jgi:hypothetical protein